jgi:hypothetical protein
MQLSTPDIYFYQELLAQAGHEVGEQWISSRIETLHCASFSSLRSVDLGRGNALRSPSSISAGSTVCDAFENHSDVSPKVDLFFRQEFGNVCLERRRTKPRYLGSESKIPTSPSQMPEAENSRVSCSISYSNECAIATGHVHVRDNDSFFAPIISRTHEEEPLVDDMRERFLSDLGQRGSMCQRIPAAKMGMLFTDAAHSVLTRSFMKRALS